MSTTDWKPEQILYIRFLASGKIDQNGKKWSREEFAKEVLKCAPATLYNWQNIPGFKEAVFDEAINRSIEFIPAMINAQVKKSIKQGDTPAFMAIMRQIGLLKSDKQEIKAEIDGTLTVQTLDFKDAAS